MKRITHLIISSLLLLTTACEKDTEPTNFAPQLTTGEATDIFRTGATLSGKIQRTSEVVVAEYGILYSLSQEMSDVKKEKVTTDENDTFTVQLRNLNPGTPYYYCTYAGSGYSTAKGEIMEFTTSESNPPVFDVLNVSNKDEKSITVFTVMIDEGGSAPSICGFCWKLAEGATNDPTENDNVINVPRSVDGYLARITNLAPGKEYLIRAYAVNREGKGYGKTIKASTYIATIPAVSTINPTDSTETSITVEARILSNGTSALSERGFCWSTESTEPTILHQKKMIEGEESTFSYTLSELKSETSYYIRAYATNDLGEGYGDVFIYTTPKSSKPTVKTLEIIEIDETKAKVTASVETEDIEFIGDHGLEYATDPTAFEKGTASSIDVHLNGSFNHITGLFNGTIENLQPGTKYYARAWALKTVGTKTGKGYGNILEFTTLSATNKPTVSPITLNDITKVSAFASAQIIDDGGAATTGQGFYYSSTHAMPDETDIHVAAAMTSNRFTASLTGLTEGTKYYIRAYAKNKKGITYGEVKEFTTIAIVNPTVVTSPVTNITETTARLSANITNAGNGTVEEKGFCWSSTNATPTKADEHHVVTASGTTFAHDLTGLSIGTNYYVRAYARNEKETGYGEVQTFTTAQITLPEVSATTITDITKSSANASASITNNGGGSIQEKGFCYSSVKATPTIADTKMVSTATGSGIAEKIGELTEGTKYYICAYARNEKHLSYGDVTNFTTPIISKVSLSSPVVSQVEITSAHVASTITIPQGAIVTEKGVCYSIDYPTPSVEQPHKIDASQGAEISLDITGLTEGAKYNVTTYARTKDGVFYSIAATFTTIQKYKPGVTGLITTAINDDNASFSATISNDGGLSTLEKGICWSTESSAPDIEKHNKAIANSVGNSIIVAATGLKYNTHYYARAYAKNDKGIGYSETIEFTTTSSMKAEIGNVSASNPTSSTIDVSATINNDGGAEIEEKGFCYSKSGNPTIDDLKVKVSGPETQITATLTKLAGYTNYYIRAYAKNKNGVAYSTTATATTKKANPDINDPESPGNK